MQNPQPVLSKGAAGPLNTQWVPYDQDYIESHYRYVEEGTGRRYRKGDLTANGIVKLIGHAAVAYTLAACKQPDSYLRGSLLVRLAPCVAYSPHEPITHNQSV